jgi:hypothetical protein
MEGILVRKEISGCSFPDSAIGKMNYNFVYHDKTPPSPAVISMLI